MSNQTTNQEEQIQYSKLLSSLFCSLSIIALSILSLLNNLSLDFYSMITLLKVVIPAAICFWFLGFVIGKTLDNTNAKIIKQETEKKIKAETEPYEIPSMFSAMGIDESTESDMGIL